jgi:hypothetical protein
MMYRKLDKAQLSMDEFFMPFGGRLSADNRWVKIAKLMPWDLVEDLYASTFKDEKPDGRPPIPARIAFGSLYIKEQEALTDDRTLEYIAENPYAQYFLGLSAFQQELLFDPSMMTHFRKRFTKEMVAQINEELYRRMNRPKPPEDDDNDGTLILDATAAPADIRYPTDLSLLNECRENTEQMIDELWDSSGRSGHKTAYNRKKARAKYLTIAKQRNPRKKKIRQAVREQLDYVKKNLEAIDRLLAESDTPMPTKRQLRLHTIREVVRQQQGMLEAGNHTAADRIVSLRQPHVRPIVRGKARSPVEFGQKLAFSVVNGFTFIDGQSWDNFNEGVTLMESAEKYKARHGVYPAAILADTIYRNRENRAFCKKNGIRLSGPRLGRPKAEEKEADRKQAYQDNCDRNMVESRNGIAKRRYGLNLVMATLSCTAQTEAALNVLAMNVSHILRVLMRRIFWLCFGQIYRIKNPILIN